jgi:hypothetical protein
MSMVMRIAGNLMYKYTLSRKCLCYKGVDDYEGCCSYQAPPGCLQTTQIVKPVYFLPIDANKYQEDGSRYLFPTSD